MAYELLKLCFQKIEKHLVKCKKHLLLEGVEDVFKEETRAEMFHEFSWD